MLLLPNIFCMRSTLFANLSLIFLQIEGCFHALAQGQGFPISRNGEPYHKSSYNQPMPFPDLHVSFYGHTVPSYQLIIVLWSLYLFFLNPFCSTGSLSLTSRKLLILSAIVLVTNLHIKGRHNIGL